MLFTLDAVFAREGDAMILHYGPPDEARWILIDGGTRGVYKRFLRPRFEQVRALFGFDDDTSFPLRMVMVSHVDSDHISGVLDLLTELEEADAQQQRPPFRIETLWHNSFDDLLGNQGEEIVSRIAAALARGDLVGMPAMTREARAVVATTGQGRRLRHLAGRLDLRVNSPFEGLVMASESAAVAVELGHGLTFTVLGPRRAQVEAYQEQWDEDLERILDEDDTAGALAFTDDSPFNLASLSVLARLGERTMLLTGDARGDHLIEGLIAAGLLADEDDSLHVDLLKVPHHGSSHNVTTRFFEQVTADHYVISADGKNENPDVETLQMIADARGTASYALHLTVVEKAFEVVTGVTMRPALEAVDRWITDDRPPGCEVFYRGRGEEDLSVVIDLGEPLVPGG